MPLVLTDVMNRADIGMIQGGSCLSFTPETLKGLAILGYIFVASPVYWTR